MSFRYKPVSESRGTLTTLFPTEYRGQISNVSLRDADGNVIEEGDFRHDNHNGNRPTYDFSKPGYAYDAGTTAWITLKDGREVSFDPASGLKGGERGPGGGGGGSYAGGSIQTSPGGNPFVFPGAVDYNALVAPYVDFMQSLERGRAEGKYNVEQYFENIKNSKEQALGLVDTDIEGIKRGLEAFIPLIREEGQTDLSTNIDRALQIDSANTERTPGFNERNRNEVAKSNDYNRSEFERSVEGTGLNYRQRTLDLLDNLKKRSEGELPGGLSDAFNTELRNRGSDLLSGTGVGGMSAAGRRITDRMTASERLNLALDAERMIPGVLNPAQQLLTAPFERAPTVFEQPTGIPLNPANVADRIPIMSGISAGAAQQAMGSEATSLQAISPGQVLGNSLDTERYNETGRYNRDLTVMDRTQDQMVAQDSAVQGALNQDKGDLIRDEAYSAMQQGFGIRQQADLSSGYGAIAGTAAAIGGFGGGGNSVASGLISGAGSALDTIAGGVGYVVDGAAGAIDSVFGDGDGRLMIGNQEISSAEFGSMMSGVSDFFNGRDSATGAPRQVNGQSVVGVETDAATGNPAYTLEDGTTVSGSQIKEESRGLVGAFQDLIKPFTDAGLDAKTVLGTANTLKNWDSLSSAQQVQSVNQLGISVLENKNVIGREEAADLKTTANSISTLMNPNATDSQRASAVVQAGAGLATTSFTGSTTEPTSIGGQVVVGQQVGEDGKPAFELADGSTVSQETLMNTSNTFSSLQAFSVLTSKASTEDKVAALTATGITAAKANEIISSYAAGNTMAALSLFNTTRNWNDMNATQKTASVIQSSQAVAQAAAQAGSQTASTALSVLGPVGAVYQGVSQNIKNYDALKKDPGARQGAEIGARDPGNYNLYGSARDNLKNVPGANAAMGTVPGQMGISGAMGTGLAFLPGAPIALAAVGAFMEYTGSGKNTGQKMRDSWRDFAVDTGVIERGENNAYNVTLADGSKYDIGRDGGASLRNTDGTERKTYDVDWGNPLAAESIPDAHLFAIATGLDPTSNDDHGVFHRSVAQSLNAATSNATSADGVKENFRAMLQNKDPREVVSRIELLRATNKITEQEYGVYIDRTNQLYGSQLQPSNIDEARSIIVEQIQSSAENGKLDKQSRQLLEELTNPDKLTKSQQRLADRIKKEKNIQDKPDYAKTKRAA